MKHPHRPWILLIAVVFTILGWSLSRIQGMRKANLEAAASYAYKYADCMDAYSTLEHEAQENLRFTTFEFNEKLMFLCIEQGYPFDTTTFEGEKYITVWGDGN